MMGFVLTFFIPLNDMFLGKIHGGARTDLFKQLYVLYKKGIALLLHIPSHPGLALTWYQLAYLQRMGCTYFQDTAFYLYHTYKNTASNRSLYIADKIACRLLKLAAKFGIASDVLYISMYYYKTFRYRKALFVLQMAKLIKNIAYFDFLTMPRPQGDTLYHHCSEIL